MMKQWTRRIVATVTAVTMSLSLAAGVHAEDTTTPNIFDLATTSAMITAPGTYTVSGISTGANTITVAPNVANVIIQLNGVEIPATSGPAINLGAGSSVTLEVNGEKNVVSGGSGFAGIETHGSFVNITGSGNLMAKGGADSAGIGGKASDIVSGITISGCTVTAVGGYGGAGIGSGNGGSVNGITITDGATVDATGNGGGAGIGGGSRSAASNLNLNGAVVVTATGSQGGAGIGGGLVGGGSSISITGLAKVTATGSNGGAGIGGGAFAQGSNISLRDSVRITATSQGFNVNNTWGAGIGSSSNDQNGAKLTSPGNTLNGRGCVVFANSPSEATQGFSKVNGILFENGKGQVYGNVQLVNGLDMKTSDVLLVPLEATFSSSLPVKGGTVETYITPTADWNLDKGVKILYHATGITLDKTTIDVKVKATASVKATLESDKVANKTLTWTSRDTKICTVNNGTITGVAEGSTYVTVTSGDSGVSARVEVNVYEELPDKSKGTFKEDYRGNTYFYDAAGKRQTGWVDFDSKKYYMNSKGILQTGWQSIEGKAYYFDDDDGAMQTGWIKSGGKWYYMDPEAGTMKTGWQKIGSWFYLGNNGAMQTGWQKLDGSWYYFHPTSGAMRTGWQKVGSKWYIFSSSGTMKTGWTKSGGKWYYMDSSGAMKTGWQKLAGIYYYLDDSGAMLTGSVYIEGKRQTFDGSGRWQG